MARTMPDRVKRRAGRRDAPASRRSACEAVRGAGLVTGDPRAVPRPEIPRLEVGPRLRHQIEIKVQVVQREQRAAENFARHREMAKVGPGETRGVVGKPLDQWQRIAPVALVAEVEVSLAEARAIAAENAKAPENADAEE